MDPKVLLPIEGNPKFSQGGEKYFLVIEQLVSVTEWTPALSLSKILFLLRRSKIVCVELHNCWVCLLEETPTLFLSCVFLTL